MFMLSALLWVRIAIKFGSDTDAKSWSFMLFMFRLYKLFYSSSEVIISSYCSVLVYSPSVVNIYD